MAASTERQRRDIVLIEAPRFVFRPIVIALTNRRQRFATGDLRGSLERGNLHGRGISNMGELQ